MEINRFIYMSFIWFVSCIGVSAATFSDTGHDMIRALREQAVVAAYKQKVENESVAAKHTFNSLLIEENSESIMRIPATQDTPEVKQHIKTYIREQSSLIFEKLLSYSQYKKAYEFSIAYRDVFATVDVENAATIRGTATTWLTQIQEKATTEIEVIAETIVALEGRDTLQQAHQLRSANIIKSFTDKDPIQKHLQDRFDAIVKAPLPVIPPADELIIMRRMAQRMFA